MKAKKWLFIIIAILLIINGAYYFVFNVVGLNNFVRDRLRASLASRTKSRVTIQKVDFNDKRLTIFGLNSYTDDYTLEIESVTIDYNLLLLAFVRVLPRKALNKVLIYKPRLTLKKEVDCLRKISGGSNLQELKGLLPDFAVIEGFLDIDFDCKGKFALRDKVDVFSCSYSLSEQDMVSSSFYFSSDSRKLESNFVFAGGVLDTFRLQIDSFSLPGLSLEAADSVGFVLHGYAHGSHRSLSADLQLEDFAALRGNLWARLPLLRVRGDEAILNIMLDKGEVLGVPLQLQSSLRNVLHPDMELFGNLSFGPNFLLEDIYAKRSRKKKKSFWQIERVYWLGNKLQGEFATDYKGFDFTLADTSFVVSEGDFLLQSSLQVLASWDKLAGFKADFYGDSLLMSSKNFIIDTAHLQGHLQGSDFSASLKLKDSLAEFGFSGNLFEDSCFVSFESQEFDPNLVLKQKNRYLPLCRVSSSGYLLDKALHAKIDIFLEDSYYGLVSGSFGSQFDYDFVRGQMEVGLRSYKSTFNYNLFDLDLRATGSFDSLVVDELVINKEMRGRFLLSKRDKYQCQGYLLAESLSLPKWQKYFTKKIFAQDLDGKLSTSLQIKNDGELDFNLQARGLSYGNWQGVDADLRLSGNMDSLQVSKLELRRGVDTIGSGDGRVLLDSTLRVRGKLDIYDLRLEDVQRQESQDWNGIVSGQVQLDYEKGSPLFWGSLDCEDFGYKSITFYTGSLQFRQEKQEFVMQRCEFAGNKENKSLSLSGQLGYNFLSGYVYPSQAELQISYQGDFLQGLAEFIPYIQKPKSQAKIDLNLWMSDEGLRVKKGVFVLKKGKMRLQKQPEKIEEMNISLEISHDSLRVDRFEVEAGKGALHISNDLSNAEECLVLGNLNLGKIYFWTSGKKLRFYYPDYMDEHAQGLFSVRGVGENEIAFVQGPADNMLISLELHISDVQAMFPKNSKNLLNLITESYSFAKEKFAKKLPFFMDMVLVFEDNVYYKTFPVNLLVDKGGFLKFHYEKDDKWELTNGKISSSSGDFEILSSVLGAKKVEFRVSKSNSLLELNGEFEATAVDGNTVSLSLKTIDNGKFTITDNLDVKLASTDKDLTSDLDIISSLKYDVSQEENDINSDDQALVNAQVLELVGDGVQSQVFDIFISPVENSLQRALRLDMFRIKMNLVQNILQDYDNQQDLKTEKTTLEGSDILLNKMKILMGKSVTNRLFLVSEFKVEESDDPLVEKKELLLNQKVGFKYILPYDFRFQYDYNFNEDKEKNLYELNLKKSIDF